MLKQYRIEERCLGKYCVYLYHDGELISEKEHWDGEEFDMYLEELETDGYEQCYTQKEVEAAKRSYEYCSLHAVGGSPKWIRDEFPDRPLQNPHCSICNFIQPSRRIGTFDYEFLNYRYCPQCGARMDGGNK